MNTYIATTYSTAWLQGNKWYQVKCECLAYNSYRVQNISDYTKRLQVKCYSGNYRAIINQLATENANNLSILMVQSNYNFTHA